MCVRSTLVQKALNSQILTDTHSSLSEMNITGFFSEIIEVKTHLRHTFTSSLKGLELCSMINNFEK